jgi:ribosomal protein S18 acetylase RimI-like enzyme
MEIKEINRFSVKVFDAISSLMQQLSPGSGPLTEEHFMKILEAEATHLFVVEDEDKIAGMMTVVIYDIPTSTRAWVEDVVVDEAQRGLGFGMEMMDFAIAFAGSKGAKSVDLTSRPSRITANRLYQKAGFAIRETNVYRYILD